MPEWYEKTLSLARALYETLSDEDIFCPTDNCVVLVKEVGKPPELRVIRNDADAFHDIVGGCFDIGYPFSSPHIRGICEDCAMWHLPFNFHGHHQPWHGTVIFIGHSTPYDPDLRSLTFDEVRLLLAIFYQMGV